MKKHFLILAAVCTFAFAACTDKEDTASTNNNVKTFDAKSVQPYTVKTAPVQEGQVTTIKVDGQVICRTTTPMQYSVPNGKTEQISYAPASKTNPTVDFSSTGLLLCFEDQASGIASADDGTAVKYGDFNDFVCYVKIVNTADKSDIYIQPIAVGSHLGIKFFLNNGATELFSTPNNVRKDLFPLTVGVDNTSTQFDYVDGNINTTTRNYRYSSTYRYDGYLPTNSIKNCRHIEAGLVNLNNLTANIEVYDSLGHKLATNYAAMNTASISLSAARHADANGSHPYWVSNAKTGAPVGIAFPVWSSQGAFRYPVENKDIYSDCYSYFYNWIFGSGVFTNGEPTNVENVFTPLRQIIDIDIEDLFSSTKSIARR